MIEPNVLGKVLGYFSEAMAYAKARATLTEFRRYVAAMGGSRPWGSGETQITEQSRILAMASAWAFSSIDLIAKRVAEDKARFQIKRRVGEDLEDVGNHPFEQLWASPNPMMSGNYLSRYSVFWQLLHGNAYLFLGTARPGRGDIQEIWTLPAHLVHPKPDRMRKSTLTGKPVIDYEITIRGQRQMWPGENTVHFRPIPNPFDYWLGLSYLNASIMGIRMDFNQAKWTRDFFGKENAIPTAIISLPKDIGEKEFEIAAARIRQEYGENRKSAIIPGGEMSVEVITQTLEQMEMVASRTFNKEEIQTVFGTQEILGKQESGDSRLAAEINFARNTIQPLLDYMAAELTLKVAPFYGENIVIAAPNIVPQDKALDAQLYSIYSSDRSINENRAEQDMKEWEAPPEYDWAAKWPVRLFGLIEKNVIVPPGVMPRGNGGGTALEGEYEQPPAMAGSAAPEAELAQQAGKAYDVAMHAELKRWRRVAAKEARAGRDPSLREFDSDVIPDGMRENVVAALIGANEEEVRAAFAVPFGMGWQPSSNAPFVLRLSTAAA